MAKIYSEKLRDPRWQKRRLHILERDEWKCALCWATTETLNVHHRYYSGEPWEAPDEALVTLCERCHKGETEDRKAAEKRLRRVLERYCWSGDLGTLADIVEKLAEFEDGGGEILALALWAIRFQAQDTKALDKLCRTWSTASYKTAIEKLGIA
jgi:hypothetical protein